MEIDGERSKVIYKKYRLYTKALYRRYSYVLYLIQKTYDSGTLP